MLTSCLIGGQDFLQQVKCGWCARWLLAVLDLVAALRWAFLVLEVSSIMFCSFLLSILRLVPVRYENGPSNYVIQGDQDHRQEDHYLRSCLASLYWGCAGRGGGLW